MRLFITSYQKSGTHQIMPMFGGMMPDVVDRGHSTYIDVPKRYGLNREINWAGVAETVNSLRTFKHSSNMAFGHVAYMPEYAKVLKEADTRVIFNVRDPRDVIVAEYENARRKFEADPEDNPLWNFYDTEAEMRIFEKPDPIIDLIIFASCRWPRWLGWLDHDFVKKIKYEDLRLRTDETAKEIFEWTKMVGVLDARALAKGAKPKPQNPTFRRGVPGEWKSKFELHHAKLAKEKLGDIVERLGYEW
ncbi:MAG: sulfotransferase domain-containing protein [Candidatus Kariarchaeaceae archaeon]|jgi:hypothetical protein